MKIAYLTIGASDDVKEWSGIPFFMSDGFARNGADVVRIQNLSGARSVCLRGRDLFRTRVLHENYSSFRHKKRLAHYARQIAEIAKKLRPDVIVCPSTLPVAYLDTDIPIAIWTDSTFRGLLDFYPGYFNVSAQAIAEGDAAEQSAFERCALALYASEWAARTAIDCHGADPNKVRVVPMGANLSGDASEVDVAQRIANRPRDRCELLLLGVDWARKGCAVAVDVARELNRRGMPTTLTIAGCTPPSGMALPECVKIIGFVDKRTPAGMDRVKDLFVNSHFLILPSRAECYGIVFAEANAFGVPILASNVGGIPTVINEGKNGFMVPIQDQRAEVEEYCELVLRAMSTPDIYRRLGNSALEEYKTRLNWTVATASAMQAIGERIG
jgi:glycosyltransferase involved in cell wall biosynthesis